MRPIFVLACACLLLFTGCAPRGESKSLSEVLLLARKSYAAQPKSDLPSEVQDRLSELSQGMERVLKALGSDSGASAENLHDIGDGLAAILKRAGHTSRPGMTELSNQFLHLGESNKYSEPQVRLLIARTYSALASELETNRFRFG